MAVTFMPAPYSPGGVAPSSVGPAALPSLSQASPLAGLAGTAGSSGTADPGMVKLAQALLAKRMKPPLPGSMPTTTQIDPNGVGGMQGPVPLPGGAGPGITPQ